MGFIKPPVPSSLRTAAAGSFAIALGIVHFSSLALFADYVPVFGSLTYTGPYNSYSAPIAVNNAGTALTYTQLTDATGNKVAGRVLRWNATSAVEMPNSVPGDNAAAGAINEAGVVVAQTHAPSGLSSAVQWNVGETNTTTLGTLGGQDTGAVDINDNGTILGYSQFPSQLQDAYSVIWAAGSAEAIRLSTPGTLSHSWPAAINNSGIAVGNAIYNCCGGGGRAIRWDAAGNGTLLAILGVSRSDVEVTYVSTINEAGTAIGYAEQYEVRNVYVGRKAVRWDSSGALTELGHLWSAGFSGKTYAYATDINEAGSTVGVEMSPKGARALRWAAGLTVPTVLQTLGASSAGYTSSHAFGVNEAGMIVGSATKYDDANVSQGDHAVVWRTDGSALDLNTLIDPASGWILREAKAISDTGWITGSGVYDPDGIGGQASFYRAFLLQVPIPLAGDFNFDNAVDGADFVTLRDGLGSIYSQSDVAVWRAHFGEIADAGIAARYAVPEPASIAFLGITAVALAWRRR
jgi:hypothetical protein